MVARQVGAYQGWDCTKKDFSVEAIPAAVRALQGGNIHRGECRLEGRAVMNAHSQTKKATAKPAGKNWLSRQENNYDG